MSLDISTVKEKMSIEYIGTSMAFGGIYQVYSAESTYLNPSDCPEEDRGQLVIIELMNDDTPMFFNLHLLNPSEWKLV